MTILQVALQAAANGTGGLFIVLGVMIILGGVAVALVTRHRNRD